MKTIFYSDKPSAASPRETRPAAPKLQQLRENKVGDVKRAGASARMREHDSTDLHESHAATIAERNNGPIAQPKPIIY